MTITSKPLDFETRFSFENQNFLIRPVEAADVETLRVWKNDNRQFFYHKNIISPEQQTQWFSRFEKDTSQQLFVCESGSERIACVGFRYRNPGESKKTVELFNLICGHPEYLGKGFMAKFYSLTTEQLRLKGVNEVQLEVLKTNDRAYRWYLRQGFTKIDESAESHILSHRLTG